MEKHAMALGYFFLAVFCLFVCGHSPLPLQLPLLLAAVVAALVGAVFFASACVPLVRAVKNWFIELAKLVPLARELPPRRPAFQEGRPSEIVAE